MPKAKQPYTVQVVDERVAGAIKRLKKRTGMSVYRIVDELLKTGLKAKKKLPL